MLVLPDETTSLGVEGASRRGRSPRMLSTTQVIVGIEQVVSQMKPGEEVQALIPAALASAGVLHKTRVEERHVSARASRTHVSAQAYGEKGVCTDDGECLIKPNTSLKYFIRLNRVAQAAG